MPRRSNILLLGFPGSGKTTFLAALWHQAEAKEINLSLHVTRLSPSREYLSEITRDWRNVEPAEHTRFGSEHNVEIVLGDDSGNEIELLIPDVSGETFAGFLQDRSWSLGFDERVQTCDTILLFVHPSRVVEPVSIQDANLAVAELDGLRDEEEPAASKPWEAKLAPLQVKLVDLMQLMQNQQTDSTIRRLMVVISAWDLVGEDTPEDWLKARMPLLGQYLRCQNEHFEVAVYGLSAQGGELPEHKERLAAMPIPSERIWVHGQGQPHHDMTAMLNYVPEAAQE